MCRRSFQGLRKKRFPKGACWDILIIWYGFCVIHGLAVVSQKTPLLQSAREPRFAEIATGRVTVRLSVNHQRYFLSRTRGFFRFLRGRHCFGLVSLPDFCRVGRLYCQKRILQQIILKQYCKIRADGWSRCQQGNWFVDDTLCPWPGIFFRAGKRFGMALGHAKKVLLL